MTRTAGTNGIFLLSREADFGKALSTTQANTNHRGGCGKGAGRMSFVLKEEKFFKN
jgi:hypothetical protein